MIVMFARLHSDIQKCFVTAANMSERYNRVMFIGDSRVREFFHELVDLIIGEHRTYVRTHASQTVTIDRLRLHLVRLNIVKTVSV